MMTTRTKQQTRSSISDALSTAYGIVEELRDELQSWYDNLPESLQNGAKGDQLTEAISGLEEAVGYEPEIPDPLQEVDLSVPDPTPRKRMSRADRRDDAVYYMDGVIDAVREYLDAQVDAHDAWVQEQDEPRTAQSMAEEEKRTNALQALESAVDGFCEEIGGHRDAIESVEFPSMFG
jgi:hypothetical protein